MEASRFFLTSEIEILKKSKNLVLVSGGPDSVFLFHVFLELRQIEGISFSVLHVNHHLRGKESDLEQSFVEKLCHQHGIECFVFHLDLPKAGNLQNQARLKRREICFGLQRNHGFHFAFTAHHEDDLMESIVMHEKRGAGLKGKIGIRQKMTLKNPFAPQKQLTFWRPLLSVTKNEILNFLKENNISFCVDSSNLTEKYLRNRVRKQVAQLSREERKKRLFKAHEAEKQDVEFQERLQTLIPVCGHFVPFQVWQSWPQELQFRFFAYKLRVKGFTQQVERKHFSLSQAKQKTRLDLGNAVVLRDQEGLYFYSHEEEKQINCFQREVARGAYFFGLLDMMIVLSVSQSKLLLKKKQNDTQVFPQELYLDQDKVKPPLQLKVLPLSSKFQAYGQQKLEKPLKDLYQKRKVPQIRRRILPVLLDAQQNIIAVPGVEVSHNVKIDEATKRVLKITLKIRGE